LAEDVFDLRAKMQIRQLKQPDAGFAHRIAVCNIDQKKALEPPELRAEARLNCFCRPAPKTSAPADARSPDDK
jgi:hypothetical protein